MTHTPCECIQCLQKEAEAVLYKYRHDELNKILIMIRHTLEEAVFLEIMVNPQKLAEFLDKRLDDVEK